MAVGWRRMIIVRDIMIRKLEDGLRLIQKAMGCADGHPTTMHLIIHLEDQYGDAQTKWVDEVKDQKSAEEWVAKEGKTFNGDQKNTDVKYIGKEGDVYGHTEDGQKPLVYHLNSDGSATPKGQIVEGSKPTTTKPDQANEEPREENKANEVLEPAGAITETAAVITHTGELMDDAAKVATTGVKVASKSLAAVGGFIGIIKAGLDISRNGVTPKNGTQMALSIIGTVAAFVPGGQFVSIFCGLMNLAIDYATME